MRNLIVRKLAREKLLPSETPLTQTYERFKLDIGLQRRRLLGHKPIRRVFAGLRKKIDNWIKQQDFWMQNCNF